MKTLNLTTDGNTTMLQLDDIKKPEDMINQIVLGDCLDLMKCMPDNYLHAIVTDPPYGLSFMGKAWDYDVPKVEIWREALRVLKPGGHLLAFAGSRTYHRMAVAIEDAGFEIRDQLIWMYGSGFPKSLNIGKAVDKRKDWNKYQDFADNLKIKREELKLTKKQAFDLCKFEAQTFGGNSWFEDGRIPSKKDYELLKAGMGLDNSFDVLFEEVEREFVKNDKNWGVKGNTPISGYGEFDITKGTSEWEGYGTALKPAHEPCVLARKPLDGTVANNVLKHGTGGLNIDGTRITHEEPVKTTTRQKDNGNTWDSSNTGLRNNPGNIASANPSGRFPANLIHDGSDEVVGLFPQSKSGSVNGKYGHSEGFASGEIEQHYQSSSGSAARFFYCAKASKRERGQGNNHPTVKPIALMKYLVKLVAPPKNGIIYDPFSGSGTTLLACQKLGIDFIGSEISKEYCEIAEERLRH